MAITNCDELSNIISLGLVSGDDELAQEIAEISARKRAAAIRSGKIAGDEIDDLTGWTAHELELKSNSADIELRAIVQAKILSGDIRGADAYRELAHQIVATGGTMADGIELLNKLSVAKPTDFDTIAKAWGGVYKNNPEEAIKEMKEAISETISANYSIRQYSDFKARGLSEAKRELRNGKITQEEFEQRVANLHKEAMEQIAKGENPEKFAKLDKEWQDIKKMFGKNPEEAGKIWSQYIMARELLADGAVDDKILNAFKRLVLDSRAPAKTKEQWAKRGGKLSDNLTGDLTIDQISKYKKGDLDKLLARAYTNTEQLYRDGNLRLAFREKLIELTSGMRVSNKNVKKAMSIMKTMEFAEKGASFSDVVVADNAARAARRRGYKVTDGNALLRDLEKFSKNLDTDPKLLNKPIKLAGVEMEPLDVVQLIYDITGDDNILRLIRVGFVDSGTILSVATSSLLGDADGAAKKIIKLFTKAKETAKISNIRDVSLKAITGEEIKEGAPVGFFDFREKLFQKGKLDRKKADYMDKLAEKNKMRVNSENITKINSDIDDVDELAEELKKLKGGYLIVNDGQWRVNDTLDKALTKANEGLDEADKITEIYPRGGMSANFSMEDGQLFYKTMSDDMYNDVAGTISIQSLGEARPTREILATAYEAKTGMNGDKIRYGGNGSKGGAPSKAGTPVDPLDAMAKYNKELDEVAAAYYGEMLGLSGKKVDSQYIARVQTALSERLGMDIKAFSEISDKATLWQRINQRFSLERLVTGKYDKQIIDINRVKNEIENLSNEALEETIKGDLGDIIKNSNIKDNDSIEHIREAYLDYKTAENAVDSLAAKGKIISLANGGSAQTMSMDDIKKMFQNGTFKERYKEMFFPNQKVSDKDMQRFINEINTNIFDTLSITFAENLVKAGYSLPLMNIKTFVRDYLLGKVDINNKFVEAFLYKNNIPYTSSGVKSLLDTLMPVSFKFDYEDSLFRGRFGQLEKGSVSAVKEVKNRFLPDSYSSIVAAEMANGADVGLNYEKDILEGILDKYVKTIYDGVNNGTLTFKQAQEIKQEASYALDMFEQDFLLPRYGRFLSPQERKSITGMKYQLPIGVKGENPNAVLKELNAAKDRINKRYSSTLSNVAENNDINASILKGIKSDDKIMQAKIDARRQQLIDGGGVIKEVNGQYIVYDVKQALEQTINNLPSSIGGVGAIKVLGRDGINTLSNKQAYALLRYLEAARGLDAKANLATELMYKQNPILLQYNFFSAFKVQDGLPRILHSNSLLGDSLLSKLDNTSMLDKTAKRNIFKSIVSKFNAQGYITPPDLDDIIKRGVAEAKATFKQINMSPKELKKATKKMEQIYKNAFTPYMYLRDIPTGGTLADGKTVIRNIKKKVSDTIKQQYDQAVKDLEAAGVEDVDNIQASIYITTDNGEKISLSEASKRKVDSWKKDIFNDENTFVAGADEIKYLNTGTADTTDKAIRQEKEWRNKIVSGYDSTLQAMLNQTEVISEAESRLTTAFMNDIRTSMRQYTLTNMIVDALDALSGLNEEAARGIKDYLIGWKGNISFGKWKAGQILERNNLVKEAYKKYYYMTFKELTSAVPESKAEDLALKLARYFKNLERLLGSADGLTGCTTKAELNRAFYHIGEVVMNIETVKGVFGLLSAVEQNQIFKFFKFAKGDLAKNADVFIRRGKGNFQESLGGYRDYAEEISGIDRDTFNEIFAANFSEGDFKRILQGLTGFTLTGSWGRSATKILNVLNGSNFVMRFLMSYPGQLLTIPQQGAAYFLKQIGFQKELGIESLSDVDNVRMRFGILDGAYNELIRRRVSIASPDDLRPSSYYNRYGIPDTAEFYGKSNIDAADDYINMYAKVDNYSASSISATNKWFRQLDPYKDNANNIIDGMFSRNFKNIAFMKALKHNDFMQFSSADDFMRFMNDPTVSATIKTRLMDRVSTYSGRNFRNILGLGFGGIDRAISGSGFGNIMYGLMQLFNFRGSWGQNIFKQTGAGFTNAFKILFTGRGMWSREGREALARYVATQPEFMNFVGALFNDIKRTWKLQRFQDNGRRPDEDMYGAMDFIDYFTDTLNMTSQWYQGLQSFGPLRPFKEQFESIFNSHMNPTIYKDTYGVGAFFNALGKNFGRQWKPYNWIAKALGAWTTDGWDGFEAYVQNKFWELSFGSLRYMVNEDMNAYGYTYEMTGQVGGIPSILMGEAKIGSDKNFSYELDNTETRETIKQIFDSDLPWDSRWTYIGNLAKTVINGSQLASLPKNIWKAVKRDAPSYFTANDLADTIQNTEAGREFYRRGIVTPKTPEEAEIFFDTILKNGQYRPGSDSFTKSLIQFDDYGHMNGKEKGNKNDAEMELWLEHMKYKTNDHGEFEISGGDRVLDPSWERLIADVKIHGYNQTYTTALIYNYSKNWLNNHSSDPNYQLYVKMLGQGQAHKLVNYRIGQLVDVLNIGKKGKDNKWTKTELENVGFDKALLLKLGQAPLEGDEISFFDKLQVLDEDNATVAALKIIKNQAKESDRKTLDRFFDVKENDDGTTSIDLKYQYESLLTQIGAVAKAIDDGNVDLAVAEASSLVNIYKNKDPSGIVTATLIDSVYNRIYDTDSFSPSQKQAAMIALFHKNKDYIQRNPEKLRELMGDDYDVYAKYMNEMLYQWDGMLISNLESMQSSGESSSGKGSAASEFSSALKNLASKIGGEGNNGGTSSVGSQKEWVPFTIKGSSLIRELGLKGYTPEVKSLKVDAYKPHADFSLKKDINRNVKAGKTEQVSTKKQLSNIEKKTTKALEAES